MAVKIRSTPFGGGTRTRVLLLLQLLGTSYSRELSRLLQQPVSVVQKALKSLEEDTLIAAQNIGRTRVFRLNPRYFALTQLEAYVERLAEADRDLSSLAAKLRRRSRRTGKPL